MYDEEDYFLPLEDQRVFGAGIRRKRIPFVRSSESESNTATKTSSVSSSERAPDARIDTDTGSSVAAKYLSIVLPRDKLPDLSPEASRPGLRCEVCDLPIHQQPQSQSQKQLQEGERKEDSVKPHEALLAHQLCLAHSHPPSHLDRSRQGLRYLSAYGWDPDNRVGLGIPGHEGIREPLKMRVKHDTIGLGVDLDELAKRRSTRKGKDKVEKLNIKQVRKAYAEDRKREERLREIFYCSEDLQRYLGDAQ